MKKINAFLRLPYDKLLAFIEKGHERSVLAKKNVVASLLLRVGEVTIKLLLVPLVLNYLDQTRYGIWLTITSLVTWFTYLDIGLGLGLRNKFAEAKAAGNYKEAKIYVSTTYAVISILMAIFLVLFFIVNPFLPWGNILNAPGISSDLSVLALIVFGFFALEFVVKLINTIVVADQKPAIRSAVTMISNLLILITIYIFTKLIPGSSLIYLGLAYSGLPVLVMILASFYFYNSDYKRYSPSFRHIDFSYTKDLMGLGWKFFFIQIAMVVILSTDNVIITQLFGPASVTPYQIAKKYFSFVLVTFTIIVTPLWSATSEALVNKDFKWIKSSVHKLQWIAFIFVFISLALLAFSNNAYQIWVGRDIKISYFLSFLWMIYVVIGMYNAIYFQVINGAGEIKIVTFVYLFAMIINIPLSIYFAKNLNFGINGVILATIVCQAIHLLYLPFQYKSIIMKKNRNIEI